MSADRMKRRRKKLESKRGVNMSFSELVQRIGQRGTPAPQQDLVERPERKKATSNRRKKNPAPAWSRPSPAYRSASLVSSWRTRKRSPAKSEEWSRTD